MVQPGLVGSSGTCATPETCRSHFTIPVALHTKAPCIASAGCSLDQGCPHRVPPNCEVPFLRHQIPLESARPQPTGRESCLQGRSWDLWLTTHRQLSRGSLNLLPVFIIIFISPFRKNNPLQIKVNAMKRWPPTDDANATKRKDLRRDEPAANHGSSCLCHL